MGEATCIPSGLVVLIGPPGSGKTSFAKALLISGAFDSAGSIVSSDEIGEELFGHDFDPEEHDDVVFAIRDTRLRSLLRHGKIAIADSTNVAQQARERLVRLANEEGVSVTALRFLTSLETALKLDADREKHVHNIEWFSKQLQGVSPESLNKEGFDLAADVPGAEQGFTADEAARQFEFGK